MDNIGIKMFFMWYTIMDIIHFWAENGIKLFRTLQASIYAIFYYEDTPEIL